MQISILRRILFESEWLVLKPVLIDASRGGQVFRTAIGLSALVQKPVDIRHIRSKREKPGLQPQHLTALKTVASLCHAAVTDGELNSSRVLFEPKKIVGGRFTANIGTAGSISLLLQSALFPALVANTRLRCLGGTDVPFSPSIDFLNFALLPRLREMGVRASVLVSVRGYFPKGRGVVAFESKPAAFPLKPVRLLEAGSLEFVRLVSHCSSLPSSVGRGQLASARQELVDLKTDFAESVFVKEDGFSKGSGISIFGSFSSGAIVGASALGERGLPAERVGQKAAKQFRAVLDSLAPVDSFLADQLVPFMALAKGKSEIGVSVLDNHVFSNIAVCEQLLDCRFEVSGKEGESGTISCQGANFVP